MLEFDEASDSDYMDAVLILVGEGQHDAARDLLYQKCPPADREAALLLIAAATTTML